MVAIPEFATIFFRCRRFEQTQAIVPFFVDLIQDQFWTEYSEVLTRERPHDYKLDDEQSMHPLF